MILALLGCSFGLDPLAPSSAPAEPTITGIDPWWGTPDGGTEVTISGTGFTDGVAVEFGNAGVSVSLVDPGTLVVTTPYAGVEAVVDVVVTTDAGSVTAPGGFVFAEDEPEDTGGHDSGGDSGEDSGDDSGGGDDEGIGGVIEYTYFVVACVECFVGVEMESLTANAAFHEGVDDSWMGWLPGIGECVPSGLAPRAPVSEFVDMGDWVYLNSRATSFSLQGTNGADGVSYLADALDPADHQSNVNYALSVPEGGAWGAFDVENAVEIPAGFDTFEPVEVLETNPNRAFSAEVSRSGQAFTWSPSGGDGTFLVVVEVYNPQGTALLGTVSCREADDGRLEVPSGMLAAYPLNSLVAVTIYRYQIHTFDLPTGASGEAVASLGFLGTGILGP